MTELRPEVSSSIEHALELGDVMADKAEYRDAIAASYARGDIDLAQQIEENLAGIHKAEALLRLPGQEERIEELCKPLR